MKIENIFSNIISFNNETELFKDGQVLTGKILEILDKSIIVELNNIGVVHANLESSIELNIGEEIDLVVKSVNETLIQLKPLSVDKNIVEQNTPKNNLISKLLHDFNLMETKVSIAIANNLMEYSIPLTKENILEGIKTFEKVQDLLSLSDNEKVVLIPKEDIVSTVNIETTVNLKKEDSNIKNLDIKYFLISEKEENSNLRDITSYTKFLLDNRDILENENKLVKIIGFLIKNNMKPSINNIRFLAELDSKPLEFIQELKDTNKNLSVLNNKSSNLFHEISGKSSIESFSLSNDGKLKVLKEFIYDLDLNLEANTKTKEEILKLGEKVQFLEELNKDLSFVFYPINSFQEGLKGLLTVIKDKRNKANLSERLFIHLIVSTKNLGEIKVNCQLFGDSFNIRMKIKDENLELFNSTKELLIEKISSLGYSLKGIEFFSNENIGTIDLLSTNVNSVYVLDMKV